MIALTLLACVATTGGARVAFDAETYGVAAVTDGRLVYQDGDWEVTLDEAKLSVGPIYLWSGRPLVTASAADRVAEWVVPTARADTDHFEYGYLRGEVLHQAALDALTGATVSLGDGAGLGGEAQSAELWLSPPQGDVATALDGATFRVAGTARRGDEAVPFVGALTIDDTVLDPNEGKTPQEQRKVRGIPFAAEMADGGTLRVGFDATRALVGADFAALAATPPNDAGQHEIAHGTSAWNVWYYQVRQSGENGPWTLTWTP
jgi:hypothetical protein